MVPKFKLHFLEYRSYRIYIENTIVTLNNRGHKFIIIFVKFNISILKLKGMKSYNKYIYAFTQTEGYKLCAEDVIYFLINAEKTHFKNILVKGNYLGMPTTSYMKNVYTIFKLL